MRMMSLVVLLVAIAPNTVAQSNPYHAEMVATAALRSATPALALTRNRDAGILGARRFSSRAPGAMFMIIGGAAIVTGALVGGSGGTILILGGVGVGAYGVYLYTR